MKAMVLPKGGSTLVALGDDFELNAPKPIGRQRQQSKYGNPRRVENGPKSQSFSKSLRFHAHISIIARQ